jgi:hypothetical protein
MSFFTRRAGSPVADAYEGRCIRGRAAAIRRMDRSLDVIDIAHSERLSSLAEVPIQELGGDEGARRPVDGRTPGRRLGNSGRSHCGHAARVGAAP